MNHNPNAQVGSSGELPSGRVEAIFDAALQLSPEKREAYLDQACGNDSILRGRIEALLKSHHDSGEFMDPPVPVPGKTIVLSIPTEKPGDKIGRYKLLQ